MQKIGEKMSYWSSMSSIIKEAESYSKNLDKLQRKFQIGKPAYLVQRKKNREKKLYNLISGGD